MNKLFFALIFCGFAALAQTNSSANSDRTQNTSGATSNNTLIVNDTDIAKALNTLNQAEIDAAKIAGRKAQNKEVKEFAKMLLSHHKDNAKQTKKVGKISIFNVSKSDMSRMLKDEGKSANNRLLKTSKQDFDADFLEQQIQVHEKILGVLNDSLIPSAHDDKLIEHLKTTQVQTLNDLNEARALRNKIH